MTVLVTGGGGFLGSALCRRLLELGYHVRSLSRRDVPELRQLGVEVLQGDISDPVAVDRAVRGCDLVFHTAAKAGIWGSRRDYHQTNVVGTQMLLDACRTRGVSRFVFTSSPSVVFCGRDEVGINESVPYARRFLAHYPATKALAERAVLASNSQEIATVALRPHLIWGPGDNHLIPRLLERAKRNQLRRVGSGDNMVDTVYIENAVEAHLLAAQRLAIGSKIAGKAYFIGNDEPISLWWFINEIVTAAGQPPIQRSISASRAYWSAWLLEWTYRILRRQQEPPMTRFVAQQLSRSHWFDLSAAREELGYQPRVSVHEGLARLRRHFRETQIAVVLS
jgi:nucleoside-diphosphate-sugar epimerase